MKKTSKSHCIHAFVISKKTIKILILSFIALAIGRYSREIGNFIPDKTVKNIVRASLGNELMQEPQKKNINKKIAINKIMEGTSPVFCELSPAPEARNTPVEVPSAKPEDKPPKKASSPAPSGRVKESNIISKNLSIKNMTSYSIDAPTLAQTPRTYNASGQSPGVLIMHSHGSESFSDENGLGIGDGGGYRSSDKDKNITKAGDIVTEILKSGGINVIHDSTLCDSPDYNSSYKNGLNLISGYIKKYPTINFVFDIHRDAIAENDGTPIKLTYNSKNEKTAQIMIVCGTDSMGLYHPYWKDNLIFALKIQKYLEEKYPGLMRPLNLRCERFNTHLTRGSLLFEIGTHGNTCEEVWKASKYLAEGICAVINP